MLTRVSPIAIMPRSDVAWLLPPDRDVPTGYARWDAQATYDALISHGALFFHDLLAVTKLLPSQLEDALRELAALGLVTSDGFTTIRALVSRQHKTTGRRSARIAKRTKEKAYSKGGRWSRFPPFVQQVTAEERIERWAWLLLRRYGVMFRDLLARESVAPFWRELAPVYRRLEMRGEIRGGRFIGGVAGEQFALPEAVEQLRQLRDKPGSDSWAVISAADPLNLVGIVTRDLRVPATRGNRVLFRNGRPIAARESRRVRWLTTVDEETALLATRLLTAPGALGHDASVQRLHLDRQHGRKIVDDRHPAVAAVGRTVDLSPGRAEVDAARVE
jgi:ATP-dependent Lhr-like helicase